MDTIQLSLEQFKAVMLAAGYDQVTERVWEPHTKLEEHAHPFEANAIVVQGEVILGIKGSEPRRLTVGDTFHVLANTPHTEVYGSEGATYWVARKGDVPHIMAV